MIVQSEALSSSDSRAGYVRAGLNSHILLNQNVNGFLSYKLINEHT